MPRLREALGQLHAMQGWLRLPLAKDGSYYGPSWFTSHTGSKYLTYENRRVSIRLGRQNLCVACDEPLPATSTGDHIIPLARGGVDNATNYLPICRSCNSSKGTQDLLEWWAKRGIPAGRLTADILCAYARLRYHHSSQEELETACPDYLYAMLQSFAKTLPTDGHRSAFWRGA